MNIELKEIRKEKMLKKQRLAELINDLAEAENELIENRTEYDETLLAGKCGDAALSKFQNAMLKTDALKRLIEDLEQRVLPGFNELEKDARKRAKQAFWDEIKPIHQKTKEEIESVIMQIASIFTEYMQRAREAENGWGASHYDLFQFNRLQMPHELHHSLSFENPLSIEAYKPGMGYKPILGGGTGFRPTDERSCVV